MARLGITFEETKKAIESIIAQGENPTIERIRKILGTGSNSTIAKYLQEWRVASKGNTPFKLPERVKDSTSKGNHSFDVPDLSISKHSALKITTPIELPDVLKGAVTDALEKIRNQSDIKLKAFQEKYETELALMKMERDEAIVSRDQMQQELETLNQRFKKVSSDKDFTLQHLKTVEKENILLQEKSKNIEYQYQLLKSQPHDDIKNFMIDYKNAINSIKELYDKTVNHVIHSFDNSMDNNVKEMEYFKMQKQKDEETIQNLTLNIQTLENELNGIKSDFKLVLSQRDFLLTDNTMKNDLIKNQKTFADNILLILSEIEKLKPKI